MNLPAADLPDDPVLLRTMLLATMTALDAERAANARLEQLLNQLRRMQFGKRSEKLDADQLNLAFEDIELNKRKN